MTRARGDRGRLLQCCLNFCRLDYHFDDEVADVCQPYTVVYYVFL